MNNIYKIYQLNILTMESNPYFTAKAERDYKLVCQARDHNDQKAYHKLMKHYEGSIYYMLLKMTNNPDDAKDLTVEAFEKAFRNLGSYEPDYAFSTWLFKIATNNCIDFIRRGKKNISAVDLYDGNDDLIEYVNNITGDELNPEDSMIKEQKTNKMRAIVSKLKPHYRNLIELHYFKELGYGEISEILHLPIGTVKAQLFRAREFLAKSMRNLEVAN